jgi:hypothetical protein
MAEGLMKNARKHKWLILASAYILLMAVLAVVDEPLNPEVESFVAVHSDPVPDAENAYYAMLGFSAPPGTDIHSRGIGIVARYKEAFEKETGLAEFDLKKHLGGRELAVTGQIPEFYKDRTFSCLGYAKTSQKEVQQLLADNRELLDRYYSLYHYPHYHDTAPVSQPGLFPLFAPVRAANRLMLLSLAREANAGRIDAALNSLARDIDYWRLVLKESNELISKLVSIALVKSDYLFLSDLISHNKVGRGQQRAVERLLDGLTREELDMSGTMRREFRFTMHQIRDIKRSFFRKKQDGKRKFDAEVFLLPFFKVNASINIIYPSRKKLVEAAKLTGHQLAAESREWEETKKAKLGLSAIYNFVGAILHYPMGDRENITYLPYLARVHDLDGLIRLVAIRSQAARQKIPLRTLDRFVQTIDARYSNPYTGTPMKWDGQKKSLYFESLIKEDKKPKRIEIYL